MRCRKVQKGLFGSLCACFLFTLESWVGSQQGEILGKTQSSLKPYVNLSTKSPTRAGREVLNRQILWVWNMNKNKWLVAMALDFPPVLGTVIPGILEPSREAVSLNRPWTVKPREHRVSFLVCFDSVSLAVKQTKALCYWPPSQDCHKACWSTKHQSIKEGEYWSGLKHRLSCQRDLFTNLVDQLCDFGDVT